MPVTVTVCGTFQFAGVKVTLLEAGVVQRVRALEAFLADVYGPAEVVRDDVPPGADVIAERLSSGARFIRSKASFLG